MRTITVPKAKLLDTLRTNRGQHRALFDEAQVRFREKVIDVLDQRLAAAKRGDRIELYINLPEPEDYTSAFDTAISMLEWETADEVELTQQDFERYVQNKWEWAGRFAASTQSYVATP